MDFEQDCQSSGAFMRGEWSFSAEEGLGYRGFLYALIDTVCSGQWSVIEGCWAGWESCWPPGPFFFFPSCFAIILAAITDIAVVLFSSP